MTAYVAYIAIGGDNKLLRFAMDPTTGALSLLEEIRLAGAPGPLAVDPTQRYLYVGLRSTKEVITFQIDAASGALAALGSAVTLAADPCYLATDKEGRWLLTASYSGGQASVYPLHNDGSVGAEDSCTVHTEPCAHCIEIDSSNRFTFLPHVAQSNVIYQYRFDATTGQLVPNSPARIAHQPNVGPRHYVYHPTLDVVYFSNEQEGSVTAYHLDPERGTLVSFQTLSTLPADFTGENTCAQLHIHPRGHLLYVSNRGHDSIAGYQIDSETGLLTSLGQQPTEPIPRAFNFDPTGNFLYVTGQGSGQMTAYRVDQERGSLHEMARYPLGERPMWVMVLALA
ncbi:MAG TPA: beta-propeller fold lactonase family protein [Caldilineaceae bacterium]|nr:beta-propeller fold lactonase family protein [Caldilineaceae bacterium]